MKNLTLFVMICICTICMYSCQSNIAENGKKDSTTVVLIKEKSYSFGTITEQDSIEHAFIIKNVGTIPLIIKSAKASCGCTIPEWSNKPVLPNQNAIVKVTYRPVANFEGIVNKSIVVRANTDSIFHVLYISGEVKNKKP